MFMMPHKLLDDDFSRLAVNHQQQGYQLDIKENDKQYTVLVDLPGYKKENLNIEVTDDNMVHIHAKRDDAKTQEGERYIAKERSSAEFTRAFRLQSDIKHDEVKAIFEDGVLQLEIQKVEKPVPKRTKVQLK
uniref:Heat shock protein Hsp20 n=1 Tax=Trepomonas sp. PC1 TaxID=1076344 RepID=A0A146KHZ5_9EUKA|eukprot:JAP95758.1 Heat shock protein Hsp20 [Trepomonas sp. PC1]